MKYEEGGTERAQLEQRIAALRQTLEVPETPEDIKEKMRAKLAELEAKLAEYKEPETPTGEAPQTEEPIVEETITLDPSETQPTVTESTQQPITVKTKDGIHLIGTVEAWDEIGKTKRGYIVAAPKERVEPEVRRRVREKPSEPEKEEKLKDMYYLDVKGKKYYGPMRNALYLAKIGKSKTKRFDNTYRIFASKQSDIDKLFDVYNERRAKYKDDPVKKTDVTGHLQRGGEIEDSTVKMSREQAIQASWDDINVWKDQEIADYLGIPVADVDHSYREQAVEKWATENYLGEEYAKGGAIKYQFGRDVMGSGVETPEEFWNKLTQKERIDVLVKRGYSYSDAQNHSVKFYSGLDESVQDDVMWFSLGSPQTEHDMKDLLKKIGLSDGGNVDQDDMAYAIERLAKKSDLDGLATLSNLIIGTNYTEKDLEKDDGTKAFNEIKKALYEMPKKDLEKIYNELQRENLLAKGGKIGKGVKRVTKWFKEKKKKILGAKKKKRCIGIIYKVKKRRGKGKKKCFGIIAKFKKGGDV